MITAKILIQKQRKSPPLSQLEDADDAEAATKVEFFSATVPAGSSRSIQGFFFFLGFCEVGGLAILLKRNEPNAKFGQRSAERKVKRNKNPAKLFWQRPGTHCLDLVILAPFCFPKKDPFYILSTGFGQRSERKVKKNLRIQLCFRQNSKNSLSNFGDFDPLFPKKKKTPLDPWHWIFFFVTTLQAKFRKEREREKKKERNIGCKHRRSWALYECSQLLLSLRRRRRGQTAAWT